MRAGTIIKYTSVKTIRNILQGLNEFNHSTVCFWMLVFIIIVNLVRIVNKISLESMNLAIWPRKQKWRLLWITLQTLFFLLWILIM